MTEFANYLLKIILCSGILYLYYLIALRNKLFHQWNRFYLLIAVLVSLIVPAFQFTVYQQVEKESSAAIQLVQVVQSANDFFEGNTGSPRTNISIEQFVLIAYILTSVILMLILLRSLFRVIRIIQTNKIKSIQNIRVILSKIPGTPFSFFNYIFWNDEIDIQTTTGQQIFQHEMVHVKEKHSLDKLALQLVLIIFWCNPFFWLMRRELKIIHEFIADKKAVAENGASAFAAMILQATYPGHFNSIANHFFQTTIKRRLSMLTKIQNPVFNYICRVLALPVIAITIMAFTIRTQKLSSQTIDQQITVVIDAGHGKMANGQMNGARSGEYYEDEIVLALAQKIKALNHNDQIKIVLTRFDEKIVDLHKRVDIAKENNADLFISLHLNASPDGVLPDVSSDQRKGFDIYVSGKNTSFQQKSEAFGSIVQQELKTLYSTSAQLLKPKPVIWILDKNICPSVLIEFGNISVEKDRGFIISEDNQKLIAQKILIAIERYANNKTEEEMTGFSKDSVPSKMVVSDYEFSISKLDARGKNFPLIIINGKETNPLTLIDKKIKGKGGRFYAKDDPEAMKEFGEKAKYGVMILENAKLVQLNPENAKLKSEMQIDHFVIDTVTKLSASFDLSTTEENPEKDKVKELNAIISEQAKQDYVSEQAKKDKEIEDRTPKMTMAEIRNLKNLDVGQGKVISFKLFVVGEKDFISYLNSGSEFSPRAKELLYTQKPGDIFTLENILIEENGKTIRVPSKLYLVIQ